MKILLTILFLSLSVLVQSQTIKTDSYWIAVKSMHLDEHGISPLDGMIIRFEENYVKFNHVFFDSIQSVPMKIRRNKILLEKKLWSKIKHIDQDSLLLDYDKSIRVKFVPLKKTEPASVNINFWNHLDWKFCKDNYCEETKLTNNLWDMYPNEIAKSCLIFSEWKENNYCRNEKWNVKVVNNNHIFVKTYGQFDYEIYSVMSYSGDSVKLKNLQDKNESVIIKIPSISDSKYNSIIKKIKNIKWQSVELVNESQAFEGESTFSKFNSGGIGLTDTTFIKMSSLKKNKISLIFEENKFKYFVSDTLFYTGNWQLASNGKEIILNKGCIQEDYIDLINIDEKTITIGKFDKIQIDSRKGRYVEFYNVLKLKNNCG